MASATDKFRSYSRPRVSHAKRQRRRRRSRSMAANGSNREETAMDSAAEIPRRRFSVDERSFTHASDSVLLRRERKCCFARWREQPKPIHRTIAVLLVVFAILKMVGGMIFGAIHVVLIYSSTEVTEDLQNPLPVYVSAIMIVVSGLCDMVLSKLRPPYMILTGMFFSISSCVITLAGLLSSATISLPKFTSFVQFQFDPKEQICVAYTRWDILANGTFRGGITFHDLPGCSLVESTLPPLILTLVVFYGMSCFASFVVCFLLSVLLCLPEKDKKLEQIRKASMSSYINYDINLDHICDEPPWGQESSRNERHVVTRKSNSNGSAYLPGVAIPYYTVPYRIPLVHCQPTSGTVYDNGSTTHLTPRRMVSDSSKCRCNELTSSSVFRRFRSPATDASANVGLRPLNQRPVIPIEFRCIDDNAGRATKNGRLANQLTVSCSRPLRLPRSAMRGKSTDRRESKSSPRRGIVSSVNEAGRSRSRGRREKRSSTGVDGAESSPPPYAELPPYESTGSAEFDTRDQVQEQRKGWASSSCLHEETIL